MRTIHLVLLPTVMAASALLPAQYAGALEKTAGSENSSLASLAVATEQKMEAIRAIVEAAINDLIARLAALEARVGALEVTAANLQTRMTQAETDIAGLKADVAALRATDANLQAQINALSGRMASAEANIASLWTYYNSLKSLQDTHTAQIADLYNRLAPIQGDLDGIRSRLASLESGRGNWDWMFAGWRPWAENLINSLNSRVSSLESRSVVLSDCYSQLANPSSGLACASGYVLTQAYINGTPGGCSSGGCGRVQQTCCRIRLQ